MSQLRLKEQLRTSYFWPKIISKVNLNITGWKKKERFSEVLNFKEMTVKEFFYAEDQVFLEVQRESYFYFVRKLMY